MCKIKFKIYNFPIFQRKLKKVTLRKIRVNAEQIDYRYP